MKLQPNRLAAALAAVMALAAGSAAAQTPAPSENATVNLIHLLVQQGVLKKEQADALVKQAEAEAAQAREATKASQSVVTAGAKPGAPAGQPGDVHVTYVPETVRNEIRDQVKAEVMAQAKDENWAQPNTFPDWVSRITIDGDVRLRDQSNFFDGNNSNEIINFQKWNKNGPVPTLVGGQPFSGSIPFVNTRQDRRDTLSIRARLGVTAQIAEKWQAGIRLATGNDDSPVSTSQTLGGGMNKKDLWLDQAFLSYTPAKWATIQGGRIGNPFVSNDILYSSDLNFDGIAAKFRQPLESAPVTLFGTVGAFSLEFANNPWSANDNWSEGASHNKWLYGIQGGADWKIDRNNSLRASAAYYQFQNITGQRSQPCTVFSASDVCSSDWSRPAFMQQGNTLFLLRNVVQTSPNPSDWNEWQFVGLASKFNLLDVNLTWDTKIFDDMALRLNGDFIRNLAYNKGNMIARAGGAENIVNSRQDLNDIQSGPNAWMLQATIGRGLDLKNKGDWLAFAGYKYIQPDALPDGFNDSTFHLGGTNARGYFLGAGYAIDKNVYGLLRWTSSKTIYGPPQNIDTLQLEVNARF